MQEFIIKYWLEVAFGVIVAGLGTYIRHLSKIISKEREEQQALRDGMKSLLMRQIQMDCEHAIADAVCSVPSKKTIGAMYDSYHALGGNGIITALYEQTIKLPTVKGGETHDEN